MYTILSYTAFTLAVILFIGFLFNWPLPFPLHYTLHEDRPWPSLFTKHLQLLNTVPCNTVGIHQNTY